MSEIANKDVLPIEGLYYKIQHGLISDNSPELKDVFQNFSFKTLSAPNIANREYISMLADILKIFVKSPNFIEKINHCNEYITDFAVSNANFFLKSDTDTNDYVLKELLELINEIIIRFHDIPVEISRFVDEERTVDLLYNLINKEASIIRMGGQILASLIALPNPFNKRAIVECISKFLSLLLHIGGFAESNLICITLIKSKWTGVCNELQDFVIDYAKNEVPKQLKILNCENNWLAITLLRIIYESQRKEVHSVFSQILKKSLDVICLTMQSNKARADSEVLLAFILYDLNTEIVPGHSYQGNIYAEVQQLPERMEDWSSSKCEIFLLIVYLLNLHARVLWNKDEVLNYLVGRIFQKNYTTLTLKMLISLFPRYSLNVVNPIVGTANETLVETMEWAYDLENIFTGDLIEMTWILMQASSFVKRLALCYWLRTENDKKILTALTASRSGCLLIDLLFRKADVSSLSEKCVSLLMKLKDPEVPQQLSRYMELALQKPAVIPQILHINCSFSVRKHLAFDCANMIASMLPTLTDDDTVAYTCRFALRLLKDYKNEPTVSICFIRRKATINMLIKTTIESKDESGYEAAKVLKALVKLQIKHLLKVDTIYIDLCMFLQRGNLEKMLQVLYLIELVLRFPGDGALFDVRNDPSYQGLYFRLQELAQQKELRGACFVLLRLSICRKQALADSPSSTMFIRSICREHLEENDVFELVPLLQAYLKAIKGSRIEWDFPKNEIRAFLDAHLNSPLQLEIQSCINLLMTIPNDDFLLELSVMEKLQSDFDRTLLI